MDKDFYNLVFATADGKYKKEFQQSRSPLFTNNSQYLIFKTENGIALFRTSDKKLEVINGAYNYSVPLNENNEWVSYQIADTIILRNITTGKDTKYPQAIIGLFNKQGSAFLVSTQVLNIWVNLKNKTEKIISHHKAQSLAFDISGQQLAFVVSLRNKNAIYYYKEGMDSAHQQLFNVANHDISFNITSNTPYFSEDGKILFLKLNPINSFNLDSDIITDKLNIWNFKDTVLYPAQLVNLKIRKEKLLTAFIQLETNKMTIIDDLNTSLVGIPTNHYALVSNIVNIEESYWNPTQMPKYSLRSFKDNSLKEIVKNPAQSAAIGISPSEKYVFWYDTLNKQYFTYEIATGITRGITKDIPYPTHYDLKETNRSELFATPIVGWLANDTAILISDQFDIWQVDPRKREKSICLTNGFGRINNIVFRSANIPPGSNTILANDTFLLTALNKTTKQNGFFKIRKGIQANPIPVGCMISGIYYYPGIADRSSIPLKADSSDVFLIRRMSFNQAPNLFITKDFHTLIAISDFNPQSPYNWLTATLVDFRLDNGEHRNGILYKPETFDSTTKYPLIFHYYEKRSNELYKFLSPDLSSGELSIPWYVSNGYIVFVPDIHYTTGHLGKDILNTIISATKYIANIPWIDTSHMGLQGHSFGGYETNYIITHSNLFKAAQSSAGLSDLTRFFGDLGFGDISLARFTTRGQLNMVSTPWQSPSKYIHNSPIYNADKVSTPLLLMHNRSDGSVAFEQSVALFTALRMLKKPVWLLQYDGEDHFLTDDLCKLDFTIRQQQFFNHYLKNISAPQWLLKTIPATSKGMKSGL